jgi:hypothetical protein
MASKKTCRSCQMIADDLLVTKKRRRHKLIDTGIECPLCHSQGKFSSHIDEELVGDALECRRCHNYIFYVLPDGTIWKDEIFIPNEKGHSLFIRDLQTNETYVFVNEQEILTLDHILQFTDVKQLTNRMKTFIVFS